MTAPEAFPHPVPEDFADTLTQFVARARWFGGKGRPFAVTDAQRRIVSSGDGGENPAVSIELVTVTYTDELGGHDLYQLPLAWYPVAQDRLGHALVAVDGNTHVYDAVHDRRATHAWLRAFAGRPDPGLDTTLDFRHAGERDFDLTTHSTLFSGEQSNSSVAFGEDALMKVFRRVTPGINPDIEIHDALTRAGTTHVAALYGWLEETPTAGEPPLQLAMIQQFLRTASDGWELAVASARNLFAEADLHPEEVGGDFAGEAHRLGSVVAEIHALLREEFPTSPYDTSATLATMRRRLDEAVAIAPALASHVDAVQASFDRVVVDDSAPAQRVHGDLHLGQTLRTSLGWKLVDFEGEPAKPLAERRLPDSPWRDVAGMLRSFDYAARAVAKDLDVDAEGQPQIVYRAQEWVQRNRIAFLEGYAEFRGTPLTLPEGALIAAYEADKAVYEVVYETRNRPGWVDIPLDAIERIGGPR